MYVKFLDSDILIDCSLRVPCRSFTDTKYLRGNNDLELNFCTIFDGEYDLCSIEEVITEVPSPAPAPALTQSDDGGGLAGWAIALIVVFVLSLVCCGGYAIAVMCCGVKSFFKDHEDTKEIQTNMYMDRRLGPTDASNRLAIMDSKTIQNTLRSHHTKQITVGSRVHPASQSTVQQVVCSNPQYPSFDDNSFSINTYSTNHRKARDPTMFIPGRRSQPDPGATYIGGSTNRYGGSSRRHYSEEPPLKPKRDPTMYVDGKTFNLQNPNPTLYVERQLSTVFEDTHSAQHGSTRYDKEAIDDNVQYDDRSYRDPKSLRSQATYSHDGLDALFDTTSFQTLEQISAHASKSMKSKSKSNSSSRRSVKHSQNGSIRTLESTSPDGKTAFSKHSHKSKRSRNASTPSSGIFRE